MRMLIAIGLMLMCEQAYAELYAIKVDDQSVAIMEYVPATADSQEDVLNKAGYAGKPTKLIGKSDLPAKVDRKYWRWNSGIGKPVIVDEAAKQADIDKEAAKEAKKEAVRVKLKITKGDWDDLTAH